MLFENIVNRGNMPVLQQVMAFTEERHKVLADNISNIDTINYLDERSGHRWLYFQPFRSD